MKIETPDGMRFEAANEAEARAFIGGFCAALDCFGIYKDGVQRIGCMENPIKEIKAQMRAQIPGCNHNQAEPQKP